MIREDDVRRGDVSRNPLTDQVSINTYTLGKHEHLLVTGRRTLFHPGKPARWILASLQCSFHQILILLI